MKKIKNRIPESRAYVTFQIFNYFFLFGIAVLCLLPLINVLSISLSSSAAAAAGEVKLLPVEFSAGAYKFVLKNKEFWTAMFISFKRVFLGGTIGIILTIITAYPLSKDSKVFKGRNFYAWFVFFTMLFGGGLIPGYLIITWTKLYDTIWALVIPGAINAFNVILMLNFFRQIPKELEEAAFIDGAGHWRILWTVIVPISKPVIATVMLFIVVGHWNSWFDGFLYMSNSKSYPLQTYLYSFLNFDPTKIKERITDPGQLQEIGRLSNQTLRAAQIFIGMIPILLLYIPLQKYFTKGIMLGSVKG